MDTPLVAHVRKGKLEKIPYLFLKRAVCSHMIWAIAFILIFWAGYVTIMCCCSEEYREQHFSRRSTWSQRAGTPQEDMTEKEYRAWKNR